MNMTRINKSVQKSDLMSSELYAKNRKQFRQELVEFKKNRRVALGPYATFYFESYETMLGQIQEMLHIEKGGDEQLKDELAAYNPLIPKGNELVATLMFEIDNPVSRADFLSKVGGIEEKVYIKIGDKKIRAVAEQDVDRTSEEGKASSVQFLHFIFSKEDIIKFKSVSTKIILGIEHSLYNHVVEIYENTKKSLVKDFN
jgi:hypothetical protein